MKKFIIVLIASIIIIVGFIFINNQNKEGINEEKRSNKIGTPENIRDHVEKENTEEIYVLTDEEKIKSILVLEEFEDSNNLENSQYLKVVYEYLNFKKAEKVEYSIEEINSIIYSIFNKETNIKESIDGLKYENGTYKIEYKEKEIIEIKEEERQTAAGKIYIKFEYKNDNYTAKMVTNTITGENYIEALIKNK